MHRLYDLMRIKPKLSDILPNERYQKVSAALIRHVYKQTNVAMIASLFCGSIVFIDLYDTKESNIALLIWAAFFASTIIARITLSIVYRTKNYPETHLAIWRNLYTYGSLLAGISWGYLGLFILPHANSIQQTLIVLMVAGVTAGSITLSAAIPSAAVLFLFFSIFPLIVSLALLGNNTYLLFDIALILYLIYSIILTFRVYDTIKSSFHLQFENDDLLDSLEVSNIKLEHAATHDPLTHLANRRLFVINLRNAIYAAKEQNHHFALFFIDLDHFKAANDLYGHQAGDQVLLAVTDRLRNYFRKDDMIARLGGDELAIIIEHVINIHEIAVVAQKICRIIEDPIDINDTMLKISASIGISIFPFDGTNEEALLHNSDSCMYYVKENGGNNYHFTNTVRELT